MPATKPEELHPLISAAVTNRDLEAYLALYEPGAALAKQRGGIAVGSAEIRAEIAPFLAVRGTLTVKTAGVVASADIALLRSRGAFSGVAPDGSPVEVPEHDAHEVARRQADGTWLFVVNDPWSVGA
jgi:ketosteroid isomerase-like protein